jgi:hypothetical protein
MPNDSSPDTFSISYITVPVDEDEPSPSWTYLFDGPYIASGYVTSERSERDVGLQLPAEFLGIRGSGPERLSSRDKNTAGSSTRCFIDGGRSYDLEEVFQGSEQRRTLVFLEGKLNNDPYRSLFPPFLQFLTGLTKRYERLDIETDGFHSSGRLHRVVAELLDTNPGSIEWSDSDAISHYDILKRKLEDWTKEEWNWWPFKRPQRALGSGEARLYWTCVRSKSPTSDIANSKGLMRDRRVGRKDGQKSLQVLQRR